MDLPPHPTRGILHPARLPTFTRVPAPAEAAHLVRWFWIPEWDVDPGRVSRQHVVGYPGCNLVVDSREGGFAGFAGPTTRASHQDLTDRGWAVGALLQPAAVPAFSADPTADRDRYRDLDEPDLVREVTAVITSTAPDRHALAAAVLARFVVERVGTVEEEALAANAFVALVESDPHLVRVEDVAARLARSPRTLQRLAQRFVGLPPAAVVRRRRLQEAAERVRTDPDADLATIAADLGYADHGHLTREFRRVLGTAPSAYRREAGRPGADRQS